MNLLKDSPRSLYFRYLIPALGSAAVVSVYSFVDTIAVGQGVGYQGSAALAVVTPLFQIAAFFGILCGMGASVRMGIAQGVHDRSQELRAFKASAQMMIFFALSVTIVFWTGRDFIFRLLGSSPSIDACVHGYGDLLILSFPLMMFCSYAPFLCRADHNPNLPLYATLIGGACNVFGDWFFVFPMKMGIFGAIFATAIGQLIQALILASHFFSKKNTLTFRNVPISWNEQTLIARSGFGTAFLEIALVAATVLMNNQIQVYMNESALAIYGVLLTISSLATHMFMGIGQAAASILSVSCGARKPKRILALMRLAMLTTVLFSILFFAIGWFFPDEVVCLFVKATDEILAINQPITRLYFVSFLFLGINTVVVYLLQSVEKNLQAGLLTLFRGVVLIAVLLLVLPSWFGADGIWYSVVLNDLLIAFFSLLCLFSTVRSISHDTGKDRRSKEGFLPSL